MDRRIVVEHVVTDDRPGDRLAHRGGGPGDGVGAKVDDGQGCGHFGLSGRRGTDAVG